MIQSIEEWVEEKYGSTAMSIHVFDYSDGYDIMLSYKQGSKHIEDTVVSGLTEDELKHYVNDGELKCDIKLAMKSEEQANMELMMIAVNRFQFHAWNYKSVRTDYTYKDKSGAEMHYYVPEFIIKIDWNCPTQHMIGKWIHATRDSVSDAYMPRFYAELSSDNRQRLIKWVIKNYTDEQKFSYQYFNSED